MNHTGSIYFFYRWHWNAPSVTCMFALSSNPPKSMHQIPADRPADPGTSDHSCQTIPDLHSRHTPTPHQPGLPILRIAPAIYRNIYFFPVSPDRPRLIVIHSLKQTDQHHYPLQLYITPQIILATFSQNLNMFPEFSVPNEV
ncbi:MAG: hypothetical protein PWQ63_1381 [Methanolobus sp.]|jgi:hypothetical protein|nr:hypothetical protein [Methanolobus sp.]MDK2948221.1 hypothetical protein [Methanolobus sp.]